MKTLANKISRKTVPERVRRIVESVFACKWSLTIFSEIQAGNHRPGAICRRVEGLSPKVMNHCLTRLQEFTILEKRAFAEIPPRVEYHVTSFGQQFMGLFELLDTLSLQLSDEATLPLRAQSDPSQGSLFLRVE